MKLPRVLCFYFGVPEQGRTQRFMQIRTPCNIRCGSALRRYGDALVDHASARRERHLLHHLARWFDRRSTICMYDRETIHIILPPEARWEEFDKMQAAAASLDDILTDEKITRGTRHTGE